MNREITLLQLPSKAEPPLADNGVCACSSMDRAVVFGTKGWGFDSLQAHIV